MPKPYDRLYRLTDEAREALLSLPDKQEVYLNPHTDFGQILRAREVEDYVEPVPDVTVQGDLYLPPPEASGPASDTLALDYHRRLQGLTPQMALDPNLWAWVCHFPLHAYALRRWDAANANKKVERVIRQHWFVENRSSVADRQRRQPSVLDGAFGPQSGGGLRGSHRRSANAGQ